MQIHPDRAATIIVLSLALLTMLFPVTLALADEGHGDGIELTEPAPAPAPDPAETMESTEIVDPAMNESHTEDSDPKDHSAKSADNPDADKMKDMDEEETEAHGDGAEMEPADHAGAESYTVNRPQENGYAIALGLTLGTIAIFGLATKFL